MAGSADSPGTPGSLIGEEYSRLARDIAGVLDIDAGLRDAMISGRHGHLASDLAGVIDIEAGLAAAIATASGAGPQDAAARPSREATPAASARQGVRTRVALTDLGQLYPLTQTSSGAIWRVGRQPLPGEPTALAYQEFGRDQAAQTRACAQAVALRAMCSEDARAALDQYFAWPRAIVHDAAGTARGALIPLIADDFLQLDQDPQPGGAGEVPRLMRELAQDTPGPDSPGGAARADRADRVFLLAQLVYAVAVLHKLGWVYGDVSFGNVAVALSPPRLLLLDCDGAAPLSDPGRRQASSADWDAPECPIIPAPGQRRQVSLQDTATDVYKLGLAVLRLLTPGGGALSSRSASRLDGELPPAGTDLIRRCLSPDRDQRPAAKELYGYLHQLAASLTGPPSASSARLVTPAVVRGHDARVQWQLERAAAVTLTAGGLREKVDPAAHPDGYSFTPQQPGPVTLEIENRFGTLWVDLGTLNIVEIPPFSIDLGNLPRLEIGGFGSFLDLSALPRPTLLSFKEIEARFRLTAESHAKALREGLE